MVRSGTLLYEKNPETITAASFQIIREEVDLSPFGDAAPVAERIAHAAGDTSIVSDLVMEGALMADVRAALDQGARVVTDSEMTRHAISRRWVPLDQTVCHIADPETREMAQREGTTRSAIAMRRASDALNGGIAVIGNAPTALFELLAMMREGVMPAGIVAFPVGFVGAVESKAALIAFHPEAPFVTLRGRRGGSAMAGAALNAIAAA
ncbi:MAG: precorrin-8X methylmutase [Pseudomonadota bacterium]